MNEEETQNNTTPPIRERRNRMYACSSQTSIASNRQTKVTPITTDYIFLPSSPINTHLLQTPISAHLRNFQKYMKGMAIREQEMARKYQAEQSDKIQTEEILRRQIKLLEEKVCERADLDFNEVAKLNEFQKLEQECQSLKSQLRKVKNENQMLIVKRGCPAGISFQDALLQQHKKEQKKLKELKNKHKKEIQQKDRMIQKLSEKIKNLMQDYEYVLQKANSYAEKDEKIQVVGGENQIFKQRWEQNEWNIGDGLKELEVIAKQVEKEEEQLSEKFNILLQKLETIQQKHEQFRLQIVRLEKEANKTTKLEQQFVSAATSFQERNKLLQRLVEEKTQQNTQLSHQISLSQIRNFQLQTKIEQQEQKLKLYILQNQELITQNKKLTQEIGSCSELAEAVKYCSAEMLNETLSKLSNVEASNAKLRRIILQMNRAAVNKSLRKQIPSGELAHEDEEQINYGREKMPEERIRSGTI